MTRIAPTTIAFGTDIEKTARGIADRYSAAVSVTSNRDDRIDLYALMLEAGTFLLAYAIYSNNHREIARDDVLSSIEERLDFHLAEIAQRYRVETPHAAAGHVQ